MQEPLAANQNSNSFLAGSDIDLFSEFLLEEAIVISKVFLKIVVLKSNDVI